jgi:phosphonate transport system substrate-binding protein
MKLGFLRAAALLCACGAVAARAQSPPSALRLGIYPIAEATKVVAMFSPLARFLGERTGRKVEIEVAASYRDHIEKAGGDVYDLAYLGPSLYVYTTARYGSKPLLARLETNGSPTYRGAIIVREESPAATLAQLRGKRIAFGDRDSTMGFLVPRYLLWKAGVGLEDLGGHEFLSNQDDVALSVLAGLYDAGAVRQQVFEAYESRGLRALAWTDPMPEHVFVASTKLDGKTRQALAAALLSLALAPGGRGILNGFQRGATGLIPGEDSDYQGLRAILGELGKAGEGP